MAAAATEPTAAEEYCPFVEEVNVSTWSVQDKAKTTPNKALFAYLNDETGSIPVLQLGHADGARVVFSTDWHLGAPKFESSNPDRRLAKIDIRPVEGAQRVLEELDEFILTQVAAHSKEWLKKKRSKEALEDKFTRNVDVPPPDHPEWSTTTRVKIDIGVNTPTNIWVVDPENPDHATRGTLQDLKRGCEAVMKLQYNGPLVTTTSITCVPVVKDVMVFPRVQYQPGRFNMGSARINVHREQMPAFNEGISMVCGVPPSAPLTEKAVPAAMDDTPDTAAVDAPPMD